MLEYSTGDIFESGCEVLVNPVNCQGVMGAGLALLFKEKFPSYYTRYSEWCRDGMLYTGVLQIYERVSPGPWERVAIEDYPTYLVSFPTKDHWRDKSELKDIDSGLRLLARWCRDDRVSSISIPALGCGLGGLRWKDVKPLISEHMGDLGTTTVRVYLPRGFERSY